MRLGPYEVTKQVGEGGMGVVFRARSPEGGDVAVKLLRHGATTGRFEREQRLLAALGESQGFALPAARSTWAGTSRSGVATRSRT